jgi:hypothetical protein
MLFIVSPFLTLNCAAGISHRANSFGGMVGIWSLRLTTIRSKYGYS